MPHPKSLSAQSGCSADDYHMLEELGSGSFGVVYKAVDRATGEVVAIKNIDLEGSDDDIREIQQEISLLATCSSEHVTRYKASFVRGVKLWIVMEYLGGGSCLDLLRPGPMAEGYIAIIMRELLRGLDYLHSTGKIHRDIKAANILLSESGQVKIADFGVAAQLTNIKSQRLTFVGTPFWMAPEVIQESGYDFHADIWSLGITAMELAQGEPPRSEIHPMKVLFLIPKEKPPRLEGSQWSKDFKDFVSLCLNKDADARPSARSLLKHAFVRRAGNTDMLQDLVQKARRFEQQNADRSDRNTRYYEETLRSMNDMQNAQEDEWVFDTVRNLDSFRPTAFNLEQTAKRRRLERVFSASSTDSSTIASSLEDMTLEAAPLNENCVSSPGKSPSTIRTPKPQKNDTQRRVSTFRTRNLITTLEARRSGHGCVETSTSQRNHPSSQRPALGLDMSYGNSPSTVRQFRRVSPGDHPSEVEERSTSPKDSMFDSDEENGSTSPSMTSPRASIALNKEGLLGRRCFAKCIDPALQEVHASTADRKRREAISRLGEAWAALNQADPEGGLALLRSVLDRVQTDAKLTAMLLSHDPIGTQLASLRRPPSDKNDDIITTADGADVQERSPMMTKLRHSSITPPSPLRSEGSPQKLILNPDNPHLRRMRSSRHLNAQMHTKDRIAGSEQMPGNQTPGLEHVGILSNVLYGRWADGLRSRWPLT